MQLHNFTKDHIPGKVVEKLNSQDKNTKQSEDHNEKLIIIKSSSYYQCNSLVGKN